MIVGKETFQFNYLQTISRGSNVRGKGGLRLFSQFMKIPQISGNDIVELFDNNLARYYQNKKLSPLICRRERKIPTS